MSALRQQPLLLARFTEREILARFAGSSLGLAWALIGPLLLLGIYSVVFGQLFSQRAGSLGTESYTLFVAIALWPWLMFSEATTRAMQAVQTNGALVKKVAFPHLLLVLAAVNSAFFIHLIGYVAVLILFALTGHPTIWTGLPTVLLALISLYLLSLGIGALLAALQTLLRDVEQAVNPALMMLHYLTPVLYPLTLIPEAHRHWLSWNPLVHLMQQFRNGLLIGAAPTLHDLQFLLIAGLLAALGIAFFNRLSPYFEDFL